MFYTKYRPQTIADLDNDRIRETLGKSLLENKWSSAYLLTGPRGTGKTTTARLIAKIVNCTDRKIGEEPCNKCDYCVSITNGQALDVIEIDAASNRGIDEIRDLREKVKLNPSSLKHKVYIIDEVHMLTTEAFNALLKTLEEPPSHVIFVLATTDIHKVPETIVSRCQHFQFSESTITETMRSLKRVVKGEKLDVSVEILEKIAERARGSFRDATKILEQLSSLSAKINADVMDSLFGDAKVNEIDDLITAIFSEQKQPALDIVGSYVTSGRRPKDLLIAMVSRLRQIILSRNGMGEKVEFLDSVDSASLIKLVNELLIASENMVISPIAQLPLELVICGWEGKPHKAPAPSLLVKEKEETESSKPVTARDVPKTIIEALPKKSIEPGDVGKIGEKWQEILVGTKPFNHSIMAFLKASRPISWKEDMITVEVFYKFHKDKLEEKKNRDVIEKVISDIIGTELKVKFILGEKSPII